MIVLALDMALSSTGYAVGELEGKVIEVGSFKPDPLILRRIEREKKHLLDFQVEISLSLIRRILILIKKYNCTCVVAEALPYAGNFKVSLMLSELHGAVRAYLKQKCKIDLIRYAVPTIRSSIGLPKLELDKTWTEDRRRKEKKQHVFNHIKSLGIPATNFDEADAAGVFLTHQKKLREVSSANT